MSEKETPPPAAEPAETKVSPETTPTTTAPETPPKEEPKTPPAEAPKPEEKKDEKEPEEGKPEDKATEPKPIELKLPEGSPLDSARVEEIAAFAKAQGFSQEQAQKLLERDSAAAARNVAEVEAYKTTLFEKAKADPLLGTAFNENVELAKRALKHFGDEEFIREMDASPFGNHPGLLRWAYRVGKAMADDKTVLAGKEPDKRSAADVLYGGSNQ